MWRPSGRWRWPGGRLTGVIQERSNNGLVVRELKCTFRLDGSGLGLMGLSCEVPAGTEEGISTTERFSRSYVFVASDSATVIEGLRSDAGPIERLTMQRRQEGGRESGGRAKLSGRPCGSREQRHTK